jgi:hypothetical protein
MQYYFLAQNFFLGGISPQRPRPVGALKMSLLPLGNPPQKIWYYTILRPRLSYCEEGMGAPAEGGQRPHKIPPTRIQKLFA